MPGDDDLIIHKSYQYFFQTLRQNPKMVGMAFTAVEVDENLLPTGKRLTPFYLEESDCITEKLVHALNRPPFVWPSLIFDSAAVPVDIFDSRFVFDWWVSIQLICNGDIILSKRDLVEYRVHQAQESFQASSSRKYFEAQLMMHQLFVDKSFLTLLNNASNVHQLLKCVNRFPPIYGDPRFGASILLLLLRTFAKPESRKLTLKRHYLAEYLDYSKVEMPLDEFPLSSKDGLLRPFSIQSGDTTILRPDSPSDHMAVNRDLAPWEIIALNSLRRLLRILRMPRKLIFTYIFGRKRH
jgi:hypothetical protein